MGSGPQGPQGPQLGPIPHKKKVEYHIRSFKNYVIGFRESIVTFFLVNRVEHQKLNQTTPYGAVWLSFWCSTRPSADTITN